MPKRKRTATTSDTAAAASAATTTEQTEEPLWKHQHTEIEPISSATELKSWTAKRLRAFEFQLALDTSNRSRALRGCDDEMDNSACSVPGKSNPIKMWAEMKYECPLHRIIEVENFVGTWTDVIARMDRDQLDWVDPRTGQTLLHIACTNRGGESVIDALITRVGAVNPYHPCFTAKPITFPESVMSQLKIARSLFDSYESFTTSNQSCHPENAPVSHSVDLRLCVLDLSPLLIVHSVRRAAIYLSSHQRVSRLKCYDFSFCLNESQISHVHR